MTANGDSMAGLVREAVAADIPAMAQLADRKRQHYRDHAAPFQTPAADARAIHEEFLPKLLEWDGFHVLVWLRDQSVVGFVVARFGSAPPPFGSGSLFHIDDFAVAGAEDWETAGRALLGEVAQRAAAEGIEKGIVVSGPASIDSPKVSFLAGAGLALEAEWWVKPLNPTHNAVPEKVGFEAAVGPAPPVYDPGGTTCLALSVDDPAAIASFEEFAAASQAVIGIVPTLSSQKQLREELRSRAFTVASEWYSAPASALAEI